MTSWLLIDHEWVTGRGAFGEVVQQPGVLRYVVERTASKRAAPRVLTRQGVIKQ